MTAKLRAVAGMTLVGLIALCLLWELWLAPLRPGGSFLALKALSLALALPGVLRARRYTYQWSSLLILAYRAEGVTRAWSDRGLSQQLAAGEIALSAAYFAAVVAYARVTRSA